MTTPRSEVAVEDLGASPAVPSARAAHRFPRRVWGWILGVTVDNPVLVREFRSRMRGTRAYWVILGYTTFLAGVVALVYLNHQLQAGVTEGVAGVPARSATWVRELGQYIYGFAFVTQALMVSFLVPALTAGAITIEREQRSYELLATTPLRGGELIGGKLVAAVAFILLLLTVSLPVVSISFLVGGVSPGEILASYLLTALTAFSFGSIGIFWSSALRTTPVAIAVSYMTVMGLFLFSLVFGVGANIAGAQAALPYQSFNPATAPFRALQSESFFGTMVPSLVSAAVLHTLLGLSFTYAAREHLENFEPPNPAWTRLSTTALWCAIVAGFCGPALGGALVMLSRERELREGLHPYLVTLLVLLYLIVPLLNSGDVIVPRSGSAVRRYLRGLLPHRLLGNELANGLPLALAWTVAALAIVWGGMVATGRAGLVPGSYPVGVATLMLSTVLFLAGVSHACSALLPSRAVARIFSYVLSAVFLWLPAAALLTPAAPAPGSMAALLHQALYLSPIVALVELSVPTGSPADIPRLLLGTAWPVSSALLGTLGLAGIAIAARQAAIAGRQQLLR